MTTKTNPITLWLLVIALLAIYFKPDLIPNKATPIIKQRVAGQNWRTKPLANNPPESLVKLIASAKEQPHITHSYDPSYKLIAYPNGDVPLSTGVCSDVVIRAFRKAGLDLQKMIHEDMRRHFQAYPKKWGLKAPDTNIDHRRVPNLQTYFKRRGKALPITAINTDYQPGDIVSWDLNGKGLAHIGLVSNIWSDNTQRFLITHNIGQGTQTEDRLFDWQITGHYRYF